MGHSINQLCYQKIEIRTLHCACFNKKERNIVYFEENIRHYIVDLWHNIAEVYASIRLVSNLARLALHATALAWLVACIDHVWAQIGSLHLDSVSINKMVEIALILAIYVILNPQLNALVICVISNSHLMCANFEEYFISM